MHNDQASERHVTDEDLLLAYYEEAPPDHSGYLRRHLETCVQCRALDRELRSVLALVDATPLPEAPTGFERDVWTSIEPQIRARSVREGGPEGSLLQGRPLQSPGARVSVVRRWALAGGLAALLVASFSLGRVWDRAPVADRSLPVDASSVSERLIRTEVENHLERSQRALGPRRSRTSGRPGCRRPAVSVLGRRDRRRGHTRSDRGRRTSSGGGR